MSILGWLLLGLMIGSLAHLVSRRAGPGDLIVSLVLGVSGAALAGFGGGALGWYAPSDLASLLAAGLGAASLIASYRLIAARRGG